MPSFRTTRPMCITKLTRRMAVMSRSGSPSTAMTSASSPGAIRPIWSPRSRAAVLSDVAAAIASAALSTALPRAPHETLAVAAAGPRHRIGPVQHLEPRRRERQAYDLRRKRQNPLHRGEARIGVVADALILRAVVEIILKDERALRVEVRAALRHQRQHVLRHEEAVLDLGAAGERRRAHGLRAVRVHDGAEAERRGFAAERA